MTRYEYKVVPAPRKGRKGKGIKGNEGRFAFAIQELMNQHASAGWEFQRAETLPSDERQGLTSSHTVYRDLLVFRRPLTDDSAAAHDTVNPAPLESDDVEDDEIPQDIHPQPENAEDTLPEADYAEDHDDPAWDDSRHDDDPDTRDGRA